MHNNRLWRAGTAITSCQREAREERERELVLRTSKSKPATSTCTALLTDKSSSSFLSDESSYLYYDVFFLLRGNGLVRL